MWGERPARQQAGARGAPYAKSFGKILLGPSEQPQNLNTWHGPVAQPFQAVPD
jgi:hypothetical protein